MSERGDVEELLADRPELEAALEEVLAVDDQEDEWTFDDLSIGSGKFGELVSAGVVEKSDGMYSLSDPSSVRRTLGEETEVGTDRSATRDLTLPSLPDIDRRDAGALVGALAFVVAWRAYVFPKVFRGDDVVLTGNDPYFYRYWVELMLEDSGSVLDLSAVMSVPDGIANGEPLLVATLTWFSALFGGSATAAGWVLAWYPVVAALIVAVFVYVMAIRITDDRRIGLAAVLLLAITPGFALRTSLGFADHHAFDYVWLALTATALVLLTRPDRDARTWRTGVAAGGLGLGIAGQTLAWDAGPLLIVPVGLVVAIVALQSVRADRLPASDLGPMTFGIAIGGALTFAAHSTFGWHSSTVTAAPALLLGGTVGVVAISEVFHRLELSAKALLASEVFGAIVAIIALRTFLPEFWGDLQNGLARLTDSRAIAETASLFSGDAMGWLLLFGFVLVLAVPYLAWATARVYRGERKWLVVATYGWYLLGLAMYQVRFVGELAPFAALFAGLGFVHLAERVDLGRPPVPFTAEGPGQGNRRSVEVPSSQSVGLLLALFLLVGGLGMVQTPVKISQITIEDGTYEAATWIEGAAGEQTEEDPDYVFSRWGRNRVYNYFVNSESRSYGYAQSNYGEFLGSQNEQEWYQRLHGRAGFVITEEAPGFGVGTLYTRLHENYGSRTEQSAGVAHFRAIYETSDGSRTVWEPVEGATLVWNGTATEATTVQTDVSIPNTEFSYERRATADENGTYAVTVAYPGSYDVGERSVDVSPRQVRHGERIDVRD